MNWDQIQESAVEQVLRAESSHQAILLTLPTGGGKTRIGMMLIERILASGRTVEWYTHRRMLWDQTASRMDFGWRIGHTRAGMDFTPGQDVTITMVPTERNAVLKHQTRDISNADVVIVDEAHLLTTGDNLELINRHLRAGHTVVGLTATPVDCSPPYHHLIIGATNTQLRDAGSHVPVHTYGPSEIDTRQMRKVASGGYKVGDLEKSAPVIFGEVIKHHKRLNPDLRPAMLFAPSVDTSKWFCNEYKKHGINAAHVDGQCVIINGKEYPSDQVIRDEMMEAYEAGEVKVLCNRFVLREGIDSPVTYHGIGATVFGSEHAFIQAGGRIMRSHPSKDHAIWQCHGGSWHRFGSLNSDRDWKLEETCQSRKEKQERKPQTTACPRCGKAQPYRKGVCTECGFEIVNRQKVVVDQVTGELVRLDLKEPKPKRNDMQRDWDKLFYAVRNSKSGRPMTWRQFMGAFKNTHPDAKIKSQIVDGRPTLIDSHTGERLMRVPPPGTDTWNQIVRYTDWEDLQ